jgi:rfaE bifunctional protein kinase chain/domain/rfaE bifunctional protein nucleotidyltransferase chain/domain
MIDTLTKIKTADELSVIVTCFGNKKVALCHGCFDVLHIGHVRSFIFAKRNADILIVSVTADKHVSKGDLRPYIPQQLRMEQVASLQVVDYVCLSEFETSANVLDKIKPDFYVKGIEYENSTGRAKERLLEEQKMVEKYGGKLIFSNDPVVMSSTKILTERSQDIELEKIKFLLKQNNITLQHVLNVIEKFKNKKVLVIGETIIDRYHSCKYTGCSSKDPILTLNHTKTDEYFGGAFVVANHFKRFCESVDFITCCNEDYKDKISNEYDKDKHGIVNTVEIEKTIIKERFLSGKQKLIKVDYLDNKDLSQKSKERLVDLVTHYMNNIDIDIVVFSDFGHGLLSQQTIDELLDLCKGKFVVADTQDRIHDYMIHNNLQKYHDIDLITPTEREARVSFADSTSGETSLARKIVEELNAKYIIFKMGKNGLIAMERQKNREDYQIDKNYVAMSAVEKNAIDPVGCGDSVLCAATLSLLTTKNIFLATLLANAAGGIMATKMGNELYTKEEFIKYIENLSIWN